MASFVRKGGYNAITSMQNSIEELDSCQLFSFKTYSVYKNFSICVFY